MSLSDRFCVTGVRGIRLCFARVFFFVVFVFFQAEDGIRYRVRSRGLGDVYKRQLVKG